MASKTCGFGAEALALRDRGPFVKGRVLDLSFAAALELKMVNAGMAKVMIEIVKKID